jgi:hypothetical protein
MSKPRSSADHVHLDPRLTLRSNVNVAGIAVPKEAVAQAIRCLLANAVLACWRSCNRVLYSRDNSYYAAMSATSPAWFSYRSVTRAVRYLVEAGFLVENRTWPSPLARFRSSFQMTLKLERIAAGLSTADLVLAAEPAVTLRTRGENGQAIDLRSLGRRERKKLSEIVDDVEAQNALLAATRIELPLGKYPDTNGLIAVGSYVANPLQRTLSRKFIDNLGHGGRFYGGWWQNLPSRARPHLLINGEPVVEEDYSCCQLRLMFGILGLPDPLKGDIRNPERDPFKMEGVDRTALKAATLIGINARDKSSALKALEGKLTDENLVPASTKATVEARRVFDAMVRHFPELSTLWFDDVGLRLQKIDADMCACVQADMRKRGIAVLSVHDSFIVAKQHAPLLMEVMKRAMQSALVDVARAYHEYPSAA